MCSRSSALEAASRLVPREKGAYVLVLHLPHPVEAPLLGRILTLPPGYYAYVGSAGGPGGLRARILRHLRIEKRVHWHIDILTTLEGTSIPMIAYAEGVWGRSIERYLSRCLAETGLVPVEGFGSTDDPGSRSHLYYSHTLEGVSQSIARCIGALPGASGRTVLWLCTT